MHLQVMGDLVLTEHETGVAGQAVAWFVPSVGMG